MAQNPVPYPVLVAQVADLQERVEYLEVCVATLLHVPCIRHTEADIEAEH